MNPTPVDRISEEALAELERIDREATKPPWSTCDRGGMGYDVDGPSGLDLCGIRGMFDRVEDAALVAAVRTHLRTLLAEVRASRQHSAELSALRERVREIEA